METTGTVAEPAPRKVLEETSARVRDYVYPWPRIEREPLRHDDDGRFVKSFPVEFPMGTGDLQQTRVRSDFSVAEYVQHVLRYHTVHFLRSLRGQRVLYARFNTTLRKEGNKQGGLMHKNSHAVVLTKAQLETFVHERDDLVGKLGSWGCRHSDVVHALETRRQPLAVDRTTDVLACTLGHSASQLCFCD